MLGAWIYQPYVTSYEYSIFVNALGDQPNYTFIPVAVAKQIVNGTNYKFIAIAEPKFINGQSHFALVQIHKPIREDAYVTGITPIDLEQNM